jgi:hypothetical protein
MWVVLERMFSGWVIARRRSPRSLVHAHPPAFLLSWELYTCLLQTRGEPDVDATGCYEQKDQGIWVRSQIWEFSSLKRPNWL